MPKVICFWQWGSRDSIRIPLYFPAILPPWYPQVGLSHSAPGDVGDHWHPPPVWSGTRSGSGRGTPSLVWWPQHQSCSLSRNPTNRRIHHAHRNYLPWWLPWYLKFFVCFKFEDIYRFVYQKMQWKVSTYNPIYIYLNLNNLILFSFHIFKFFFKKHGLMC